MYICAENHGICRIDPEDVKNGTVTFDEDRICIEFPCETTKQTLKAVTHLAFTERTYLSNDDGKYHHIPSFAFKEFPNLKGFSIGEENFTIKFFSKIGSDDDLKNRKLAFIVFEDLSKDNFVAFRGIRCDYNLTIENCKICTDTSYFYGDSDRVAESKTLNGAKRKYSAHQRDAKADELFAFLKGYVNFIQLRNVLKNRKDLDWEEVLINKHNITKFIEARIRIENN